jgi:asparagine synthetase B (glutamine-hydrolysing)
MICADTNQLYIPNGLDDLSSLKSSLNIGMSSHQLSIPFSSFNMSLPSPTDPEVNWNQLAIEFASILEDAVKKRLICSTARPSGANVAVLFSGGLDSAVLAALVDRCIEDSNEEIDLVNVAFDQSKENDISNFDVPDRLSAIQTLQELNPARKWNLILVNF